MDAYGLPVFAFPHAALSGHEAADSRMPASISDVVAILTGKCAIEVTNLSMFETIILIN